jgi:cell division protein FtsN
MVEREPQFVTMSRQGILMSTVMGVGLLTLAYVIGVQVGKRGLEQSGTRAKTLDEELNELPEPLEEQLKLFQSIDGGVPARSEQRTPPRQDTAPQPRQEQPAAAPSKQPSGSDATKSPASAERYTAQVIATASPDTAKRISEQLKGAGMPAKVLRADGLYKVQLDWSLSRAELDARLPRLRTLGYRPVPVKLK